MTRTLLLARWPRGLTLTECLIWLTGADPAWLHRAYPDRSRYVSLGASVLAASVLSAAAPAAAAGMRAGAVAGWFILLLATLGAVVGLRYVLRWMTHRLGVRGAFRTRLIFVVVGLLLWVAVVSQLFLYALQPRGVGAMVVALPAGFVWVVRLGVALILLVPVYGLAASRRGVYARAERMSYRFDRLLNR